MSKFTPEQLRHMADEMWSPENRSIATGIPAILRAHADALEEIAARQAKIDALMLEYCPDEMTPEQVANWERHQVAARDQ